MKITQEQYDILESEIIIAYASKQSQYILHQMVMEWNWDCSDSFLNWSVDNPSTDIATILMIYWKSAPRYVKQFHDRKEVLEKQSHMITDFDFIEKIEHNYQSGFYSFNDFAFDPSFWAQEYTDIKVVREIPEVMFKKVEGKNVSNPINFTEGCPPELDVLLEEHYNTYH